VLRTEGRKNIPQAMAVDVWLRDGICCRYCGYWEKDRKNFHLDHVHPVSRGGQNTLDNLVVACRKCNMEKGSEEGWTPLSVEDAKAVRRKAWSMKKRGRFWRYRPDPRCRPNEGAQA
jgi:hypothetical protein